jgi:uncharacterized protein (AIM24 family)
MEDEVAGENGFADIDVRLEQGERIMAEPGAMSSYSENIEMETGTGARTC